MRTIGTRTLRAEDRPGETGSDLDTPLLLDTHIWIWVVEGDARRISAATIERIEDAARAGLLLVHPMSVWEVAMLARRGRLTLSRPVHLWAERALSRTGLSLLSVTPAMLIDAADLEAPELRDPVDRMLVAAARRMGAELVTLDEAIRRFARTGAVRVAEVSVFEANSIRQ